jgi:hypothetical protein
LYIDGFTSIANKKIKHPKLLSKDVLIKTQALIIDSYWALISIDSSSTLKLNKIKLKTLRKITQTQIQFTVSESDSKMKRWRFYLLTS